MAGQRSRRRGYRAEVKIRAPAEHTGLGISRAPISGSPPGCAADLMLGRHSFKVIARAQGCRQIYRWLQGYFGLVVAVDRREPLVVIRLGDFLRGCQFRE